MKGDKVVENDGFGIWYVISTSATDGVIVADMHDDFIVAVNV